MSGFTFFEFFAGGGMARAGLGDSWRCLFANKFDRSRDFPRVLDRKEMADDLTHTSNGLRSITNSCSV
jgi:hypothetical protein